MKLHLMLFCFVSLCPKIVAANFTARWISSSNGSWNNPTNWDIGTVPNNTAADLFDVVWSSNSVVVLLETPVTVRNLTLSSGGTLTSSNVAVSFNISGNLDWSKGTLAGRGTTAVSGQTSLHAPVGNRLRLDGRRLLLNGSATMICPLQFIHAAGSSALLEISSSGQMQIGVNSAFEVTPASTSNEVQNYGQLLFTVTAPMSSQAQIINRGSCIIGRTVNFAAGIGIRQLAGTLNLNGANIPRVAPVSPGGNPGGLIEVLEGDVLCAQANLGNMNVGGTNLMTSATIAGSFNCDQLKLFPSSELKLLIYGLNNLPIQVRESLELQGRLRVEMAADVFESLAPTNTLAVVNLLNAATLQGQFSNVNFGDHLALPTGSLRLDLQAQSPSAIILTDFHRSLHVSVATNQLSYPLNNPGAQEPSSEIVLEESLTIQDPLWDWSAISLDITLNRIDGSDKMYLSPANPSLLFTPGGVYFQTGQFVLFAVVTNIGANLDSFHVDFTTNATSSMVSALLQSIVYRNDSFRLSAFVSGAERWADRIVDGRFRDQSGNEFVWQRRINFPHQTGIRCQPFLGTANEWESEPIVSLFSNGSKWTNGALMATYTSDCTTRDLELAIGPVEDVPLAVSYWLKSRTTCNVEIWAGPLSDRFTLSDSPGQHGDCTVGLFANSRLTPGGLLTPAQAGIAPAAIPEPVTLAPFYALENWLNQSVEGRRLAGLYWAHTAEVFGLALSHPEIVADGVNVLAHFEPGVIALMAGQGSTFQITQPLIDELNLFCDKLITLASPELKDVLLNERARFNNFQSFVGKSFVDWATMLQMQAPTVPWIYLSSPRFIEGRFSVEMNYLPGVELNLWRSADMLHWEPVANILREGGTRTTILTDPAASNQWPFYKVSY
jgi:hypothetical protein